MTITSLIRTNIRQLKPYTSARDEFSARPSDATFLDANENPYDNGLNRYPDSQQKELKASISKIKGVAVSNILLGNGSDEILDLIFRVFCEPNQDKCICLTPTYGMYDVLAKINAVETIKIQLSSDFQPKVDEILEASNSQTKVLFLCSPNNPTGNTFNKDDMETLITSFPGIVVIDEAYIDFSACESWLNRLCEFPNLIIIQTLSKAYGMAGIRLGMCFASEEIVRVLNSIKPPYNVNQLTQSTAIERLKNTSEIRSQIDQIKKERIRLQRKLNTIAFVETVYESDANFLLVQVDNATIRYDQLVTKGVVVRNRSNQPLCDECLRITIGTPQENDQLITLLKNLE